MKIKLFMKSIQFSTSLIIRSSKLLIFFYLTLTMIASTINLLYTYILKVILDDLINGDNEKALWLSAVYVLIVLVGIGEQMLQKTVYSVVIKKAEYQYECDLAEKTVQLPLSVVDSAQGRNRISQVRYARLTSVVIMSKILSVIPVIYTFSVAVVLLFKFNAWFLLFSLLLIIPCICLKVFFNQKSTLFREKKDPDTRKISYYRWMLTDVWPAKDVRVYNLTESIKQRYNEVKEEYILDKKKLDKKRAVLTCIFDTIRRIGEISFSVYVVYQALSSQISIGDVAFYIGLFITATYSFEKITGEIVHMIFNDSMVMSRVFDFFAIQTESKTKERVLSTFESLAFQNVCFKYPYTDNYVLKCVSFTLNKGDKLSLVGINGSGKSTIVKLMLGLYEIESGDILINGYPLSDYDIRDVRKLFSVLFQSFVQYPLTLRDNISLSDLDRAGDSHAIDDALKKSGVYDEIQEKLSDGLNSYMTRQFDDHGTELSKGQWQKIALSRVYFKNADIFIFDEPSAALDAEAEDRIFKNFESISEGKTGIMISHRVSAARMSNKIIVLDGGVITESGTHDELIAQNGLYAKLYNLQKEKYMAKEGAS